MATRAFEPVGLAVELARALRTRAQIAAFGTRAELTRRFPEAPATRAKPTVVAVVTHVADPDRPAAEAAERLERTLDGLLESLGHTRLELVLNTIPGRHAAADLPPYLRSRLALAEHEISDPMFLGFEAQSAFESRAETADWFLYLEDDILVADSLLLEKLDYFNGAAPPDALLLPHRYELWRGRKTYIDLVSKASPEIGSWNRLTVLRVDDWKFAEFENPHSGFYCLSRPQLRRWLATGRHWYGKISHVASRESAATGCLAEAFRLYKPHPDNMTFLEVRHWDTKYSELQERLHGTARTASEAP
jgi:hypothetical protein